MGLGIGELLLLINLKKTGYISRKAAVIELGAQQLSDSFLEARAELQEMANLFEVPESCPLPIVLKEGDSRDGKTAQLSISATASEKFWKWLGCSYSSIDIDGSPGSIPLDLNYDDIPIETHGAYHVVTNCGTTEHLVNQLNAFKVIHELTAPGGVMIHNLPAQGMFDHGVVNYNPKFFWMLARSNGYKWLHMSFTHGESYPLPENIINELLPTDHDVIAALRPYQANDCSIRIALQKVHNSTYVPILDVPSGTTPSSKEMEDRYWSLFRPDPFSKPELVNSAGPCTPSTLARQTEVIRLNRVKKDLENVTSQLSGSQDSLAQREMEIRNLQSSLAREVAARKDADLALKAKEEELAALQAERDYFDKVIQSAVKWQCRSWSKRAFHRWRQPARS